MDDRTSALAIRTLNTDQASLKAALDDALDARKGKDGIALADALALIRAYQAEWVYRTIGPLTGPLIAAEDRRRYLIDRDIRIRTQDGATVCALVVRPRAASGRMPGLLNFTIYSDPTNTLNEARRTASNGYAGIEGYTRGKACSPDRAVPYEHDGADAAAVIDWISKQAWSDGRVGMYGGSYEGFTQWAAAKRMPKALKALMPSVTAAPGIDVPMEGNIFQSFVYYWPFYTTNSKTLDDAPYRDRARWDRMKRQWYVSGSAYRSLDRIDGTPNPFFDRWLEHSDYDAYWQAMIPYRQEFARIDIPVLTTTGYYDDAQIGALYYFIEHNKYNPRADHYLLIGPYDHVGAQRRSQDVLNGYRIDPVARLSIEELRYDWFDYVLKGAAKPALLKDKVNYEVMAANQWKHAPSLAAMSDRALRFHLRNERSGSAHRLGEQKPASGMFVTQTIDLADRTDIDRVSPSSGGIVDKALDTWNSIAFVSDPFKEPTEVSGLFSGHLDFVTNKRDFDFGIALYELTTAGDYIALSYFKTRASHAADNSRRRLLVAGRPQQLDFRSGRLTSRQFQTGSRLVVLLGVIRDPYAQINYGTGKDVSDETIADAGQPLQIQWSGESFVDIPVAAGGTRPR
jgi:putative CocE/NonD family hydrolase